MCLFQGYTERMRLGVLTFEYEIYFTNITVVCELCWIFFRGIVGLLKYWALDETVPIMQTFKRMFLNKICLNLDSNFSAFCLNWQQLSIGLGNGSVFNRRQAITRYPKQSSPRSVMSQDVSRPLWAKTNRGSSRLCEIRRFMWCWSSPLDP